MNYCAPYKKLRTVLALNVGLDGSAEGTAIIWVRARQIPPLNPTSLSFFHFT